MRVGGGQISRKNWTLSGAPVSCGEESKKSAINKAPHLASFIVNNSDSVKSAESLIDKASKEFAKEKVKVHKKFNKLLEEKRIDNEEFDKAVNEISLMAAAELGEYILYRETIIKALETSIEDYNKKEEFIHNIFMPMKTQSFNDDIDKQYLSNLWLLDDKFMTYSYVASDKSIKQIAEALKVSKAEKTNILNRPDTTILFNRKNEEHHRDAIVIEFKGANASKDEKNKSITELPNDIRFLRNNVDNINSIWGYIITNIDEDFDFTLMNSDFKPLFTADGQNKSYYKYYANINSHIYVIDIKSIVIDALARNKTFLDILKKE
ncbi:MAG: hypothetical protein ACLUG4_07760 [Bacilli bacterium]